MSLNTSRWRGIFTLGLQEAYELKNFLDHLDANRSLETGILKKQRRDECVALGLKITKQTHFVLCRIEKRLLEKGWTQSDFRGTSQNDTTWSHLVYQAKPLTDRSR